MNMKTMLTCMLTIINFMTTIVQWPDQCYLALNLSLVDKVILSLNNQYIRSGIYIMWKNCVFYLRWWLQSPKKHVHKLSQQIKNPSWWCRLLGYLQGKPKSWCRDYSEQIKHGLRTRLGKIGILLLERQPLSFMTAFPKYWKLLLYCFQIFPLPIFTYL